jgi:hypothetical protein
MVGSTYANITDAILLFIGREVTQRTSAMNEFGLAHSRLQQKWGRKKTLG